MKQTIQLYGLRVAIAAVVWVILAVSSSLAQHVLKFQTNHAPVGEATLVALRGQSQQPVAHLTRTEIDGRKEVIEYTYTLPANHSAGLYRLMVEPGIIAFDLILSGRESVYANMDAARKPVGPYFLSSNENRLYGAFIEQYGLQLQQAEILSHVLNRYPDRSSRYYTLTQAEYAHLFTNIDTLINGILTNAKDFVATSFVKSAIQWLPSPAKPLKLQVAERITHHFDFVEPTDPVLLNSPVWASLLQRYASLQQAAMPDTVQQVGAYTQRWMDELMKRFASHDDLKNHLYTLCDQMAYQSGQDEVQLYLAEHYGGGCTDTDSLSIKRANRLARLRRMQPGQVAPALVTTDVHTGKPMDPKTLRQKSLVVFWASWCDHCRKEIPRLATRYAALKDAGIGVFGFSLDDDPAQLRQFLAGKAIDFPVGSDFKAWRSPIAEAWNIYATPVYFLLNEAGVLLARSNNIDQILLQLPALTAER